MPVPNLAANRQDFQARDPVASARQSIVELDQALGPLDEYRAELNAKPKPHHATALMEAIRAKHPEAYLTEEELELAGRAWRCTECSAVHVAPHCCSGAPLIRAGVRFFAERPHLLKQLNGKSANGHDVTEPTADVTKVTDETDELRPMTSAERVRKHRAKRAAEQNGGGLIDELFPKGSPACDVDWEAHDPGGQAGQHRRAFKWQALEGERLAVECALLRDGAQISKGDIKAARKVARHWLGLATALENQRRPNLNRRKS